MFGSDPRSQPMHRFPDCHPHHDFEADPRSQQADPRCAQADRSGRWPSPGEAGAVRWDLVRRIRAQIARGELDTPEKWDVVLERLLVDALR
jgi:hypothetical protein